MTRTALVFGLIASLLTGSGVASAQTSPVVVELFTSQGCSSCPPADAYLAELAGRDDVLPLALHVDYWDRLGWADTFAHKAFTERQYAYGQSFGNRSVWTPQFVVQGRQFSKGNFRDMVDSYIAKQRRRKSPVTLDVAFDGKTIAIDARRVGRTSQTLAVIVAHYIPKQDVAIKRGENAGLTASYHNVVKSWTIVDMWSEGDQVRLNVPDEYGRPFVVLVQEHGPGAVVAAANIR